MKKLSFLALAVLAAPVEEAISQRLLGVHADASGPGLNLRIPNGLSVIREVSTGAFHFTYGSMTSGIWIYDSIPVGDYEMWHSAPGFGPAPPWALSNPVSYPASGDLWASACLPPTPNAPTIDFQIPGNNGLVTVGTSLDLESHGATGASALLLISTAPQLPPIGLNNIGSLVAIDILSPNLFFVADLGSYGAAGLLFASLPIPNDPTYADAVLFLQVLEASPALSLTLSNFLAIRFV